MIFHGRWRREDTHADEWREERGRALNREFRHSPANGDMIGRPSAGGAWRIECHAANLLAKSARSPGRTHLTVDRMLYCKPDLRLAQLGSASQSKQSRPFVAVHPSQNSTL